MSPGNRLSLIVVWARDAGHVHGWPRWEMFVQPAMFASALSPWLRACHAAPHSQWRMRSPPGCPAYARVPRRAPVVRRECGVPCVACVCGALDAGVGNRGRRVLLVSELVDRGLAV
eukprot:4730390-Prymnesium_polylepis.1